MSFTSAMPSKAARRWLLPTDQPSTARLRAEDRTVHHRNTKWCNDSSHRVCPCKDGFLEEISLTLTRPQGFSLGGGRVAANQDQVRITLTARRRPPMNLCPCPWRAGPRSRASRSSDLQERQV